MALRDNWQSRTQTTTKTKTNHYHEQYQKQKELRLKMGFLQYYNEVKRLSPEELQDKMRHYPSNYSYHSQTAKEYARKYVAGEIRHIIGT